MLNFFNFKKFDDKILVTNDTGNYSFISKEYFKLMINDNIPKDDIIYRELKDKFFITDESADIFLSQISDYLRNSKGYLFKSTNLHIFVVTNLCNMKCVYCQAKYDDSSTEGMMSEVVAKRAVDIALSSPSDNITIEFQGGEPLLNFKIIKYIIEYSQSIKKRKNIIYNLVSNLTLLNENIIEFLIKYNVNISTSLDGNEIIQGKNRLLKSGENSFRYVEDGVALFKSHDKSIGAIETTTRYNLGFPKEIVNAYLKMGFKNIFVRPLTQLGLAKKQWEIIGYTAEEFIDFYKSIIEYLLVVNKEGKFIKEGHASIFLEKILNGSAVNYMELRSPCGSSIGQMAYYFDGNIYTCDEGRMLAEMGNSSFMLGNVFDNNYDDLIESPICKAACTASTLESLPSCCDCVYQPYCGVCPVINLSEEQDIFSKSPNGFRCNIYRGMLDTIFNILKRNNSEDIDILNSWIN